MVLRYITLTFVTMAVEAQLLPETEHVRDGFFSRPPNGISWPGFAAYYDKYLVPLADMLCGTCLADFRLCTNQPMRLTQADWRVRVYLLSLV